MKQLSLIKHSNSFGGELLKGKRKSYRPLSTKRPLHLVLRSNEVLKIGSFIKHKTLVEKLLKQYAQHFHIHIYDYAICSNHIHLTIRFFDKVQFQNFLRVFCGQVAQKLKAIQNFGSETLQNLKASQSFWEYRPFTRVLHWGRDLKRTLHYMTINWFEANGGPSYRNVSGKIKKELRI